jgi:hypothetical protein
VRREKLNFLLFVEGHFDEGIDDKNANKYEYPIEIFGRLSGFGSLNDKYLYDQK